MKNVEHTPNPSRLFRCRESGRKVLAMFLPDSQEYATIPANTFWSRQITDVTGLWIKQAFLSRFELIE